MAFIGLVLVITYFLMLSLFFIVGLVGVIFLAKILAKKKNGSQRKFIFLGGSLFLGLIAIFVSVNIFHEKHKNKYGNLYALPSYNGKNVKAYYKIPGTFMEYRKPSTVDKPESIGFYAFYPSMKPMNESPPTF